MSNARQQGFSLLEVLVAFVILSISLGILYQAMGNSLRNLGLSSDYTQAMIIAESKLAEFGSQVPLVSGSEQGATESGFSWQVDIQPYPESIPKESGLEAFQVQVAVSWNSGQTERHYLLNTLRLYNPKVNR